MSQGICAASKLHHLQRFVALITTITVGAVCSEHRVLLESKFIAFYHYYRVILQDMVINYVVDTWQKSLASAHSRSTKVSEKDVIFLLRKVSLISSGFCKRNCETFISTRILLRALHLRTTWHIVSCLATALGDQLRCIELAAWQRTICFLPRFIFLHFVLYTSCISDCGVPHHMVDVQQNVSITDLLVNLIASTACSIL